MFDELRRFRLLYVQPRISHPTKADCPLINKDSAIFERKVREFFAEDETDYLAQEEAFLAVGSVTIEGTLYTRSKYRVFEIFPCPPPAKHYEYFRHAA